MATEDIQPAVENKKKVISKPGEEFSALKRPSDSASDYQPETKKPAISSESTDNKPVQQRPAMVSNGGQVSECMMVPDKMVGLLIGKGGEQITAIQNQCQCRVQFAPETGSPTRQCTITGPAANVMNARKMIDDLILKNQFISLEGGEVALEMMIPGGKVGLVIGKSGDTIKQLQERSGAKVTVIQESTATTDFEKPLRISGTKQNCQKARDMVLELLNDAQDKNGLRGGPFGMGGVGGVFQGNIGGKHSVEIPVPRNLVGIVIGKGGEMIKKVQEESGAKVQFRPDDITEAGPNRMCHVYGFKNNNDMALAMIHDLIKQGLNRQNGGGGAVVGNFGGFATAGFQNNVIHTVPTDKCGLIIGKGGENIKEINRVTGAHAELIRENDPHSDPSTKRFRVQGTPEQIQHCITLINEKAGLPPPPQQMNQQMFGGVQQGPPLAAPFAPINAMQGGTLMSPYQQATQVLVPSQQVFTSHLPNQPQQQQPFQSPAPAAAAANFHQPVVAQIAPYAGQQAANPAPLTTTTTLYMDPAKGAATGQSDPNAAWTAYYNSVYPGQVQQAGVATVAQQQTAPVAQQPSNPSIAYAAPTQVIPANPQPVQPQPTINPQTGQPDYSLAWAEYYKAQGMYQQAAAVMQVAGIQQNQ